MGPAPTGTMFVRALYDYEADDRTSLSFHEGDVIQVITQLESGWWDGVINGVRGWFPSNYCQIITGPDDMGDIPPNLRATSLDGDGDQVEPYEESLESHEPEFDVNGSGVIHHSFDGDDKSRADFWIPQATPDGRLFYYNMMTGDRSMELPLETPSSNTETGPRDRMNAMMPDRTRPPPEMMARGLNQDEDDDGTLSASDVEGEYAGGQRSMVHHFSTEKIFKQLLTPSRFAIERQLAACYRHLPPLTLSTALRDNNERTADLAPTVTLASLLR